MNARQIASSVLGYVETACGEMGYDEWFQEEKADEIRAARKRGVTDIGGWLADELYNDAGTVQDLAWDRLWDESVRAGREGEEQWKELVAEFKSMVPHLPDLDFPYVP